MEALPRAGDEEELPATRLALAAVEEQVRLVEQRIAAVEGELMLLASQVEEAAKKVADLGGPGSGVEVQYWMIKEQQLRTKENKLRTEKEQLRTELLLGGEWSLVVELSRPQTGHCIC